MTKTAEQERAAIVAFMRDAVDQGYSGPPKNTECEHGVFSFQDCIACYDAHLYAKLDAIERGDHHGESS